MSDALDQLCINTVRFLSVDAVQQANSGHPGLPLGAAAMAYVLWTRMLKQAVEQHRPVSGREHEAVAIEPVRITRIVQ